jgi:hypothetical protein
MDTAPPLMSGHIYRKHDDASVRRQHRLHIEYDALPRGVAHLGGQSPVSERCSVVGRAALAKHLLPRTF